MAKETKKRITVMTPKFRAAFANVFTPKAPEEGKEAVFSIAMIFDEEAQKSPEFKKLKAAAVEVAKAKFPEGLPRNFRTPFRDAEEKEGMQGYEPGHIFCNAKSKFKPGLVDENVQDIISQEEFYSGCYARATLTLYAYDVKGNKGVAFGLQNLQRLGKGEAFGGRTNAADEFDTVDGFDAADDFGSDTNSDDDFGM